jgi:hypothetical protein
MKGTRKTTYRPPNSSSLPTMPTMSMACSVFAQMADWDDMPHTAAKASCRSVVASMLFGVRFRMPFRTFVTVKAAYPPKTLRSHS